MITKPKITKEPRHRWEELKDKYQLMSKYDAYQAIEDINTATLWASKEPQWWLEMMSIRRGLVTPFIKTKKPKRKKKGKK